MKYDQHTYNVQVIRGWLAPCDERSEEWLRSLREGEEICIRSETPRNPAFHRLAFKVFGMVIEAVPNRWPTVDNFRHALCLHLGFVDEVITLFGEVHLIPRSMSFANMDEIEFRGFWNAAQPVISEILGNASEEAREEIFKVMDGEIGKLFRELKR